MKNLFAIAAVFSILSVCVADQKASINAGVLNVRVKPSSKSDMICQLKRGDEVTVMEKGEEWTAIRLPENSSLYISSPLISEGKLKSNGNLRSGPGVNFQSLGIIPAGTPVNVIEEKNSWSKISIPALPVKCYVATRYLKFVDIPAQTAEKTVEKPLPKPDIKKGDILSFDNASLQELRKRFVKGTEKNITVTGTLRKTSNKNYGSTYSMESKGKYYHVAGIIPASVNIDSEVEISGTARIVNGWKYQLIEIEKISNKK